MNKSWIYDVWLNWFWRQLHPAVTDPVASIFSQGFRKKRHWVDKFSTRLSLSVRSMPCLFQTCTNDICWVCLKPQTNQVKLKLKFHQVTGRRNFHWMKGENLLGRVSLGLLQRVHNYISFKIKAVMGKVKLSFNVTWFLRKVCGGIAPLLRKVTVNWPAVDIIIDLFTPEWVTNLHIPSPNNSHIYNSRIHD